MDPIPLPVFYRSCQILPAFHERSLLFGRFCFHDLQCPDDDRLEILHPAGAALAAESSIPPHVTAIKHPSPIFRMISCIALSSQFEFRDGSTPLLQSEAVRVTLFFFQDGRPIGKSRLNEYVSLGKPAKNAGLAQSNRM